MTKKKHDARFELLMRPSEREALAVAASRRRRSEASIVREALGEWHARHGDDEVER
jgi:hypothetical protein